MKAQAGFYNSLWYASATPRDARHALTKSISADVVIIGAGYVGSSAALHLAEKGKNVVVLEAQEVGFGGSGRNVGLVNPALFAIPSEVEKVFGAVEARNLIQGLGGVCELVDDVISRHGIECDRSRTTVLKAAHNQGALKALEVNAAEWSARGKHVEIVDSDTVAQMTGTSRYCGGMLDHRSFHIQPLSYVRGLARAAESAGAVFFEQTRVQSLHRGSSDWGVDCGTGSVRAKHVIVSTGAYETRLINGQKSGFVPAGCFLYATEPLTPTQLEMILPDNRAVYDTQPSMIFLRLDRDHRLIVGSLGRLPSNTVGYLWASRVVKNTFPQLGHVEFSFAWDGLIDITANHMPWLSMPEENLYAIGGFNGRGIGQGTLWGSVVADWIAVGAKARPSIAQNSIPQTKAPWAKSIGFEALFRAYRVKSGLL